MIAQAAVLAVVVATFVIGTYGVRIARTTSDFFVASRSVSSAANASAICGEYLSAASFLGIAGLVMKYGADMLWYPAGYAAGYLVLLLFVAAPLRRFGAYTIPDFAEGRLGSRGARHLATAFVLAIGLFYLLPQMKGAGVTLRAITGAPYWVGVVTVGAVVSLNVALGGMRGITYVQAFQYWLKAAAIAVPALALLMVLRGHPDAALRSDGVPRFHERTSIELDHAVSVVVSEPTFVTIDDVPLRLDPGERRLDAGTQIEFTAGAAVPHAVGIPAATNARWLAPSGPLNEVRGHPLFSTYSLIIATFLGTMGLPHILVRFYTNPDGATARRTTLIVLCLLGAFYLFPAVYAWAGRSITPELYVSGDTDTVVLSLPERAIGGLPGEFLGGLVAAGAFAAFLSTASGLLVSVAGAVAQDLLGGTVRSFRLASVGAGAVAVVSGLYVERFDINQLVAWAFAVAASTFCPLLVLGIWWPRLTAPGAIAGLTVGGLASSGAIVTTMIAPPASGWTEVLLAQPAAWSVPLAFVTMIGVSAITADRVPGDVTAQMMTLHLPESLGQDASPEATSR